MKILTIITKVLAVLLAAAFILILPASLVTYNLDQHLMQPEDYKAALETEDIYRQIPVMLADSMAEMVAQQDPEKASDNIEQAFIELLQSYDEEDWLYLLNTLMPEDWVQIQVETIIDDFFLFMDGETEYLDINISLKPLKDNLEGPKGALVLKRLVESLKPCTEKDIFNFILEALTTDSPTLPVCAPPPELLGENMEALQFLLPMAADEIPSEISLQLTVEDFSVDTPETDQPEAFNIPSNLVLFYRQAKDQFQWSLLVGFALLILIALLAVRSVSGLAFWWGWPLTIGSAVALVPILQNRVLLSERLTAMILERFPASLPLEIVAMAEGAIEELNATFMDAVLLQSEIFFILGIGLLVIGRAIKGRQRKRARQLHLGTAEALNGEEIIVSNEEENPTESEQVEAEELIEDIEEDTHADGEAQSPQD